MNSATRPARRLLRLEVHAAGGDPSPEWAAASTTLAFRDGNRRASIWLALANAAVVGCAGAGTPDDGGNAGTGDTETADSPESSSESSGGSSDTGSKPICGETPSVLGVDAPITAGAFVRRPYAMKNGHGPVPTVKHLRMAFYPGDGRIYVLGGDYGIYAGAVADNTPHGPQSARQEKWSFDNAAPDGDWKNVHPYAAEDQVVQPAKPDTHGFCYDSKRERIWFVPGFQFGSDDGQPGTYMDGTPTDLPKPGGSYGRHEVAERDPKTGDVIPIGQNPDPEYAVLGAIMYFVLDEGSPQHGQWVWPDIYNHFSTGGEGNLSCHYDPVLDRIYIPFQGGSGPQMAIFEPETAGPKGPDVADGGEQAWTIVPLRNETDERVEGAWGVGKAGTAIDVEGRAFYFQSKSNGNTFRYDLDEGTARFVFQNPMEQGAALHWDQNHKVLFAYALHYPEDEPSAARAGLHTWDPETGELCEVPVPTELLDAESHRQVGNNSIYDPANDALVLYGSEDGAYAYYYLYRLP